MRFLVMHHVITTAWPAAYRANILLTHYSAYGFLKTQTKQKKNKTKREFPQVYKLSAFSNAAPWPEPSPPLSHKWNLGNLGDLKNVINSFAF
jgi:hypothetical protein